MKFCRLILIAVFILNISGYQLVLAQGMANSSQDGRISLSLRNIDINDALKFFALKSGFNIVPTQKVGGRVTLNVVDVPVRDVFDIMLRSNSLAYDLKSEIYNVMTEAEYKALYGKNFSDTRKVKVFRLKYAIPEQAFSLLEALKSDIGRLLAEPDSGAVMLIDTPEKISEAEKALGALEQKNTVRVFNLKYAKAKDVEEQLKSQLDLKKVGTIKADDRTNQVIVQTLPERMKNVEDLIVSLDKKTRAVMIDTKIIKIKLNRQNDEGIEWEGLFNLAAKYGTTYLGSYPFAAMTSGITNAVFKTRTQTYTASVASGGTGGNIGSYPFSGTTADLNTSTKTVVGQNMHVGIFGSKHDFDVLINYIQTIGKSKIMASPSISVVNNQEAKLHIGERQAYVTTTTTTGSTTKTVSEEVTFVDVGIALSLTPQINDDGYVTIKVKPEISSVVGSVPTSSGNSIPIVDTSTAETTVLAKDGQTIIIGGLGREEKTESSAQVPILGKIPLLGFLFRSSTKTSQHVELLIMLTPIIFEGDRFISSKEINKLPVKPVKKFDVFRPEVPQDQEKELGAFIMPREKGARSYDNGAVKQREAKVWENLAPISQPEMPVMESTGVVMPGKEGLSTKGFKSYN